MELNYGTLILLSYIIATACIATYAARKRSQAYQYAKRNGIGCRKLRANLRITSPNSLLVRPILTLGTVLSIISVIIKSLIGYGPTHHRELGALPIPQPQSALSWESLIPHAAGSLPWAYQGGRRPYVLSCWVFRSDGVTSSRYSLNRCFHYRT